MTETKHKVPQTTRNQSAQEHQLEIQPKKQSKKTIRHHCGSHIANTKHPPPLPKPSQKVASARIESSHAMMFPGIGGNSELGWVC